MASRDNPLFNSNRMKLGLFCPNTFGFPTLAADLKAPTWPDMVDVAQVADRAGFEALIPVARWKGYIDGRPAHRMNEVIDPFIYSAAMAVLKIGNKDDVVDVISTHHLVCG